MSPQVSFARSIQMVLTNFLAATLLPLQVHMMMSKERYRFRVCNQYVCLWHMKMKKAPCYYMISAAKLCNMLALCYANL